MLFKLIKSVCAKEKKRYNKNELDEKIFFCQPGSQFATVKKAQIC